MEARVIRLLRAFLLFVVSTSVAGSVVAQEVAVRAEKFETLVAAAKAEMMTDPRRAVVLANKARKYIGRAPRGRDRAELRAMADWLEGEALTRTGNTAKAAPLVAAALTEVERAAPGGKLHADILLSQGSIFADRGVVALALRDLQRAHDLYRKLGETRSRAKALSQIAILYYDANDFDNAIKYALIASDVLDLDVGIALSVHNTLGNAYKEKLRFADANREYALALNFAKQLDSPLLEATILNNISSVSLATGNLTAAASAIHESLAKQGAAATPGFRAQQQAIVAKLLLQRGKVVEAEHTIDQVFTGRSLARTTLADREAHRTAYEVYRRLGQPALALAHLAALKRLDDDATTLARSNSAALMGARFDFANQELRIAQLKADDLQKSILFERTRARTQRLVFLGIVAGVLLVASLLLIALFAIRRSRNDVRSANAELETGNTALAKALAAKSEFLAVTSHEIRTPLNGILGMTQVMLADRALDETVRERVGLVHSAGTTMRALVDDILDFAKIETGKLTLESTPFDLCELLDEACRLWRQQAQDKGLVLSLEVDACPTRIVGDPARLRQILFNLLGNALKFTDTGEIRLRALRRGARVFIAVADSGIGVAAEKQDEIFESFRQADASTSRRFGGTGLGLTICRSLAHAMGGEITVESEVGRGSTFTLDLPLVEAMVGKDRITPAAPASYLLVDPNPISRAMQQAMLAPVAGAISTAEDVAAALALIRSHALTGMLIEERALRAAENPVDTAALIVAAAGELPVSILWPGDDALLSAIGATGADVIAKPVARADVIAHVAARLAANANSRLVTRAA